MSTEPRAHRGHSALHFYGKSLLNEGADHPERDPDTLTDLLTDLRHHAAAVSLDFDKAVRLSEVHFKAERTYQCERCNRYMDENWHVPGETATGGNCTLCGDDLCHECAEKEITTGLIRDPAFDHEGHCAMCRYILHLKKGVV